jgi:hypothetical protein
MSLPSVQPAYGLPGAPGVAAGLRAVTAAPRPATPPELDAVPADAAADGQGPAEPSQRALQAVQAAARAYEQLRSQGRELHFKNTETGLKIEVYDGTGQLVRRIPPNEALAIAAAQEATWLA